jgi:hypothetical protein
LESSGPVKACNGIALPFTFTLIFVVPISHVQTAITVRCLRCAIRILFLLLFYFHTKYLHKHINLLCTVEKQINKWSSDKTTFYNTNIFFIWLCRPTRAMASSFLRFRDHTQRQATVGRTPLDE